MAALPGGCGKDPHAGRQADPLEAVLINTAGGLTGGDRIAWRQSARAPPSSGHHPGLRENLSRLVRQRRGRLPARRSVPARASPGCRRRRSCSTARRSPARLDVDSPQGAEALVAEARVFGRRAMGEAVRHGDVSRPLAGLAERPADPRGGFRIGPDVRRQLAASRGRSSALQLSRRCCCVAETPSSCSSQAREIIGEAGGASAWTVGGSGKLLARIVRRERLFAAPAAGSAAGHAQRTGSPAQNLVD